MMQRITDYLLLHRWQAFLLTALVSCVPIGGPLGMLFAAFITLRRGTVEGAWFTFAASIPYILGFFYYSHGLEVVPLDVWAAVGVAIFSNILTWVFAVMLYRHSSWSSILQTAALLGVLLVSVVHLAYPGVADWWGEQLQTHYASATELLKPDQQAADSRFEMINVTKQFATGVLVAVIMLVAVMQLVCARWWEAALYRRGSLRKELHSIRLSRLAGVLFILSLVLSYLGNNVVFDIMPVLYLLFLSAGLSLVHYVFGLMVSPMKLFWLALFYTMLIISLPFGMVIVALLALFDIWFDFRKRVKRI